MTKHKIAFQGELGAYSHIACNSLFKDAEIKTCSTFEETFKTAYEQEDYKIVIPLENSSSIGKTSTRDNRLYFQTPSSCRFNPCWCED